jgi:hypothetical protein
MCMTVTVVTGHSVALSRRSHLFSTMSSLHDVLVYDNTFLSQSKLAFQITFLHHILNSMLCGSLVGNAYASITNKNKKLKQKKIIKFFL